MVLEAVLDGIEDDPRVLPLLPERVVHHLGLVLGAHAGEDLTLRLGDAELLEGVLDLVGHVVPRPLHAVLRADVEVDLVEDLLEAVQIATPLGHGLGLVDLQRLEPKVQHPLGLVLVA